MNKLLQLLFVTSLLNAYPDIPDELTGEKLKEMPAEVLDEFLDELRDTDEDSVTIDSFLADGNFKTHDGFLTIHQREGVIERSDAEFYIELKDGQIDSEFIYFAYVLNAPQAAGVRGGAIGQGAVLEFRKFKTGLGLYKKNTYFSNETVNNIGKSDLTNILEAFVMNFDIVAEQDGRIIIEADDLFMEETLNNVSPNLPPEYRNFVALNLGRLDSDKTFVEQVRNYPKNTAVEVNFAFENNNPNQRRAVYAVSDARYSSISARHLFVEMPNDQFEPRVADQRVGYFSQRVTDMSTYDNYPQRDLINKWRLIKKDPTAELSEPVEPIVFWVDKATPEEIKPMVVKGIEVWNLAYERAGFKNAVVAKIQPDDSDWDAGDIQYNVVRWSSSPEPGFSGYGPSIGNPRTGELIAADIVQEFNAIKRGYNYRKLWGWTAENDPLEQWIISLTMHEVGHTIGLRHNFSASYLYGPREVHDKSITGNTTIASIMDYDPINIAPPGLEQGNYFPTEPGEYDRWAIEFAYKPNLSNEERADLLALSVLPAYRYGTDGDAMGTPGRNIDPRTRRGDMSNDVVTYTADRFITLDNKIAELPEIYSDEGETKNDFTNSFYSLVSDKGRFMDIVAGQVGGVYITRLVNGQDEVNAYEPVPYEKQKAAMNLITTKFFANGVWTFDPKILKNLQREKRATSYSSSGNEDPQLHDMVLGMQGRVLASLLHPNVMTRLVDSAQYGNTYMPAEVLQDLFNGIFVKGEAPDTFKRNLQSVYVDGLISVFAEDSTYDDIAKASVFSSLVDIQKFTKGTSRDPGVKAHYQYLNWKVSNFLDGKVFNLLEEE